MHAFRHFLTEVTHDARWYENLPDIVPPPQIRALESSLGISGQIKWKQLTDPRLSSRSVASLQLVAMNTKDVPNIRIWYHEIAHVVYPMKRELIDRLAGYIKQKFKVKIPRWYQAVQIGGETHSGRRALNNEVWAALCSLYWDDYKFPEDPTILQAMQMILK